ncbi:MAG: hypothetical protein Q8K00_04635 [Syntrophales bacterium]|nr:hypothetical protein [Syntrophales bacterium]
MVATFKQPVTVEVITPVFVPLASLATQDTQKLGKGSHRIEIGFMESGCYPKLVHAVIRNGMVTTFEVEPCEHSERVLPKALSKEMNEILAEARKRIIQEPWQPVPVSEFVESMARESSYPTRIGWGAGCIYLCIWNYCLFCCLRGNKIDC